MNQKKIYQLNRKVSRLESIANGTLTVSHHRIHKDKTKYNRKVKHKKNGIND